MENAILNMLFFLFGHLVGKTNKWLAEYIQDSNGLEKTGYQIKSKTYYELTDFNMIIIIYMI